MKYLAMIAALMFAGSAFAVDCVDCHNTINVEEHTEMEATIATCDDCHGFTDHHELDTDLHTSDLTITDCADCHTVE
ncbi:hypothetical protein AB4140_01385 [Shewanella sp. 10N.286.51.B2]|uniref:hypothetical protein n=1 Tax=unclassified Shewanella TaxID=196818 RepID=UPI0026E46A07|nr:hypothetical protein [Shewanella sp. 6_MG-2023]MDO6619825.1 hypothetical protein [Shewanella sp. 6_MG-2023]